MKERTTLTGKRLQKLRGKRTLAEVARAVGVSQPMLSQYETGKKTPSDKVKIALAKYYHRSVQYIFFAV